MTASDITTLQAAYTAESLAVYVYGAAIANHAKFNLANLDYFEAARADEVTHKNFLAEALGAKTPTGLKFQIPAKYLMSGKTVLELGHALETAFIAAYLGAVTTLSSTELKEVAAQVAAERSLALQLLRRRPRRPRRHRCVACIGDDPGDGRGAQAVHRRLVTPLEGCKTAAAPGLPTATVAAGGRAHSVAILDNSSMPRRRPPDPCGGAPELGAQRCRVSGRAFGVPVVDPVAERPRQGEQPLEVAVDARAGLLVTSSSSGRSKSSAPKSSARNASAFWVSTEVRIWRTLSR